MASLVNACVGAKKVTSLIQLGRVIFFIYIYIYMKKKDKQEVIHLLLKKNMDQVQSPSSTPVLGFLGQA
jgi:hypothetical protein